MATLRIVLQAHWATAFQRGSEQVYDHLSGEHRPHVGCSHNSSVSLRNFLIQRMLQYKAGPGADQAGTEKGEDVVRQLGIIMLLSAKTIA